MDSIGLLIYGMEGTIIIIIVLAAFRGAKSYFKLKRPFIKTPKFRGKTILRDEKRFGTAVVTGLEKTAPNEGFIHLVSQNGIPFKEFYTAFELEPDDVLEAIGGGERPIYRRKGVRYSDEHFDREKIENEAKIIEQAAELKKADIDKKVIANESATLKDVVIDIFKELKETPKVEVLRQAK